jgi:hypothetical protein
MLAGHSAASHAALYFASTADLLASDMVNVPRTGTNSGNDRRSAQ